MGKVLAFGLVFLLGTLVGGLAAASGNNGGVAASGSPQARRSRRRLRLSPRLCLPPPLRLSPPRARRHDVRERGRHVPARDDPHGNPCPDHHRQATNQAPSHHEFVIVSGNPTGTWA